MNSAILEKEFESAQITKRKGPSGLMLDYVETPSVIRRLNAAFDYNWSFEIVSWKIMDTEVVVQGKLTADGITKSQFGSYIITKSQNQGNGTITQEQLAEIKQLRTSLEWKPDQVLDIVERMFGNRDIMAINPVMATNLIAHLQSQGNGATGSKAELPF